MTNHPSTSGYNEDCVDENQQLQAMLDTYSFILKQSLKLSF